MIWKALTTVQALIILYLAVQVSTIGRERVSIVETERQCREVKMLAERTHGENNLVAHSLRNMRVELDLARERIAMLEKLQTGRRNP